MRALMGCFYCGRIYGKSYAGRPALFKTVDHIIPKSKGGNNTTANTVFCCHECNFFKKDMLPAVFLHTIKRYNRASESHLKYSRYDIKTMLTNTHRLVMHVKRNLSSLIKKP